MNTSPKPGYRTSSFFLVIVAALMPFLLPVLATLVMNHTAFTVEQKAEYMRMVFDLCKLAFPSLGVAYTIMRGLVSVKKAEADKSGESNPNE